MSPCCRYGSPASSWRIEAPQNPLRTQMTHSRLRSTERQHSKAALRLIASSFEDSANWSSISVLSRQTNFLRYQLGITAPSLGCRSPVRGLLNFDVNALATRIALIATITPPTRSTNNAHRRWTSQQSSEYSSSRSTGGALKSGIAPK